MDCTAALYRLPSAFLNANVIVVSAQRARSTVFTCAHCGSGVCGRIKAVLVFTIHGHVRSNYHKMDEIVIK